MNIITWGKVINHESNNLTLEFIKDSIKYNYKITIFDKYNHVIILNPLKSDSILLEFTDHSDPQIFHLTTSAERLKILLIFIKIVKLFTNLIN